MNTKFPFSFVKGYHWENDILNNCKKEKKLLRVSMAIPGGPVNTECNMKCIFCFTDAGRHNSKSEFKRINNETIISFAKDASKYAYDKELMNYFFVSEGEPTLNPELVNVLSEVAKLGGSMTMFTNLFHISKMHIDAFTNIKNLFVCGKLYGITAKTNDYLTGVPGSFDKMMKNIRLLIDKGLANENRLGIQCVANSYNYDEVFDIFTWARENKVAPHIMLYRTQGLGEKFPELELSKEQVSNLYKRCAEYDREKFNFMWEPKLPLLVFGDCYVPATNMYLVSNGDVHVCAGDTRSYGNYFKNSFKDMINSSLFENLIKDYKTCPWVLELESKKFPSNS